MNPAARMVTGGRLRKRELPAPPRDDEGNLLFPQPQRDETGFAYRMVGNDGKIYTPRNPRGAVPEGGFPQPPLDDPYAQDTRGSTLPSYRALQELIDRRDFDQRDYETLLNENMPIGRVIERYNKRERPAAPIRGLLE